MLGHNCVYCVLYVMCVGAEGKVDESLAVLAEVENLKAKKKEAEVTVLFRSLLIYINF